MNAYINEGLRVPRDGLNNLQDGDEEVTTIV
jgi:hypothetical protein